MFKKLVCLFCLILTLGFLRADETALPTQFYVKERFFALTTVFDIKTTENNLGCVYRKFFTWTPEYHLEDVYGVFQAKARMRFLSLFVVFDVSDAQEKPLGTINEKFTWIYSTFDIVSPEKKVLAEATLNFWGTKWVVRDPIYNQVIATLSRPFLRLTNNWTVEILDSALISENKIHPHLFLTLMAFQVDREYWREIQESKKFFKSQIEGRALVHEEVDHYLDQLKAIKKSLADIEPSEEDFLFIEELPNAYAGDEPMSTVFAELIAKLTCDHLTEGQKMALYCRLVDKLQSIY